MFVVGAGQLNIAGLRQNGVNYVPQFFCVTHQKNFPFILVELLELNFPTEL